MKIGKTTNIKARIAQIQTGCPHKLNLYFCIWVPNDCGYLEKEIHKSLDGWDMEGEWFNISVEFAVTAILYEVMGHPFCIGFEGMMEIMDQRLTRVIKQTAPGE